MLRQAPGEPPVSAVPSGSSQQKLACVALRPRYCLPRHLNPKQKPEKFVAGRKHPTAGRFSKSGTPPCRAASAASGVPASSEPQSDAFWRVVLPTAVALILCNMDRICMAVAIVPMAKEFGWAPGVQGIIQSAFLWGYIGTTGLGGSLADRYGGKVVMASSIFWFSLASLLLPVALAGPVGRMGWTLPAVLIARAFVGLGEGASMPAMNNLMATRVPPQQRASAIGAAFTGFHSGNLVGLALSPLLLSRFGWRGIFYIFGILGAPLLAAWWALVPPDTPRTTSSQASSSSMLQSWKKFLSRKATWAIVSANFVNHWSYFILLNWMPSYFVRALGLDLRASSFLSFLPWIVLAVGSTLAGMLADRLVNGGWSKTRVRKVFQSIAFLTPAAALLILANPSISPRAAVTCLTFALGVTSLGQAGFVANMSDIAPTKAGQMFGLCNTFGSFAGILGTATVGFIVEATGSFDPVFKLTSALCVAATLLWNFWCTGERVFD